MAAASDGAAGRLLALRHGQAVVALATVPRHDQGACPPSNASRRAQLEMMRPNPNTRERAEHHRLLPSVHRGWWRRRAGSVVRTQAPLLLDGLHQAPVRSADDMHTLMRMSGMCRAAVRILQELAPRCRMIIYTGDTASSEQLQMRARDRFGIRLLRCVTPPPGVRQALHLAVQTTTCQGTPQRRVYTHIHGRSWR
jgi:hypothetical protein